jgi:hypothetical protein
MTVNFFAHEYSSFKWNSFESKYRNQGWLLNKCPSPLLSSHRRKETAAIFANSPSHKRLVFSYTKLGRMVPICSIHSVQCFRNYSFLTASARNLS